MRAGYYRPVTVHRAEIGYDATGKVLGWQHSVVSQSIVKGSPFEGMIQGVDPATTEGLGRPTACHEPQRPPPPTSTCPCCGGARWAHAPPS